MISPTPRCWVVCTCEVAAVVKCKMENLNECFHEEEEEEGEGEAFLAILTQDSRLKNAIFYKVIYCKGHSMTGSVNLRVYSAREAEL